MFKTIPRYYTLRMMAALFSDRTYVALVTFIQNDLYFFGWGTCEFILVILLGSALENYRLFKQTQQ